MYFISLMRKGHVEKIIEKPKASTSASTNHFHQPLSRRQSHNVNVEDIIAQQVKSRHFFERNCS